MELDFDKYCVVERSPTTVLTSPKFRTKASVKNSKTKYGNIILNLNEDFTEISFDNVSCKDENEAAKRGSVYQDSKEVRLLKKIDAGRNKIELSIESSSTFGLMDSLCSSDEDESMVDCTRPSSVTSLSENMIHSSYPSPIDSRINDGNSPRERDIVLLHSPDQMARNSSLASSPKSQLSPTRKFYDPFSKSKSQKSPLSSSLAKETGKEKSCDPAHLQAILKLEKNKNGVPFFEFSVKSPENVYIAQRCKVENSLTWVYIFHSIHRRRKRNASGWGSKDGNIESSVLGQMRNSCDPFIESKGAFNESVVTEFVLYDTSLSRNCTSQPLGVAELGTELEIAAIIIQVPFEKRNKLKYKCGDSKMDKPVPKFLDLCQIEQARNGISKSSSLGKLQLVVPAGNHSLPSNESGGPSSLLDRWRFGGGCDCGGWDMACPLNTFSNPNIQIPQSMDDRHAVELFVEGRKEYLPAFTMKIMEDGKYEVDFHAKLSSLQAFSICVAILHASESSYSVGQERSKQKHTMKVFAEEEIKHYMIDSIAEEEESIKTSSKMDEESLQFFVVNSPFSPIART